MLKPVNLTATGRDEDGRYVYVVHCQNERAHKDYSFTVSAGEVAVAAGDNRFESDTYGDPAADALLQAILSFHKVRQME